jgi:hypothetical protein
VCAGKTFIKERIVKREGGGWKELDLGKCIGSIAK